MSNKKMLDPGKLPRNLVPGTWLVEPKDEHTNRLIASRLGEEMRHDKVMVISGDPPIEVMWEVTDDMIEYLRRCGDAVSFVMYRVSSKGFPIKRDHPRTSLKLY